MSLHHGAVVGLDYDAVGDTTSTVMKGIVIPIGLGAVFMAIITSYLGWWRPAIREDLRAPKWLWVVPVLIALPGVGFLVAGAPSAGRSGGYLLSLAVGTLLVGFSEEMLCRGTGLVGLRGGFKEPVAWAVSCLIFGLIHALNAFFGQGLGSTIMQIISAFLAGSVFYLTRRLAGTLVVAMVLHAWIDFSTLAFGDAAQDTGSAWVHLGTVQYAAFLLALVGVFLVLRRSSSTDAETAGAHAAA